MKTYATYNPDLPAPLKALHSFLADNVINSSTLAIATAYSNSAITKFMTGQRIINARFLAALNNAKFEAIDGTHFIIPKAILNDIRDYYDVRINVRESLSFRTRNKDLADFARWLSDGGEDRLLQVKGHWKTTTWTGNTRWESF